MEVVTYNPTKIKTRDTVYGLIRWLDNCRYIIKYDSSKMRLTQNQKIINKNGGLLIIPLKTTQNCLEYISILKIGNKTYPLTGRICKKPFQN